MTFIPTIPMWMWRLLLVCSFGIVLFFHIWQLDEIPRGFYVDESSIGYNAARIAEDGKDEHGKNFPIFFESFGEYKNPLYIYAAAGVVKVFGVSELSVRATSFLFFALFLAGFYLLTRYLFPRRYGVQVIGIFIAGTLPWFFSISRIAFEVISQLTVTVWVLVYLYRTYEKEHSAQFAVISGFLLGLSLYTYSTARLLTFCMIVSVLLVYHARTYWCRHALASIGFLVAAIPYILFSFRHPGALTQRFYQVTYLYDITLSVWEKVQTFFLSYVSYVSPKYLFLSGDSVLRHHPGSTGQIFWTVGFLVCVAIAGAIIKHREVSSFWKLLAINFLCAPVAAALTTGDSSLRTILVGLYLALFAVAGCAILLHIKSKYVFALVIVLGLSWESYAYLRYYFQEYPSETISAFESYDFEKAFLQAVSHRPQEILVSDQGNNQYAHMEFYTLVIKDKLGEIPVVLGYPSAAQSRCVITTEFDSPIANQEYFKQITFSSEDSFVRTTCFQ